MEANWPPTNAVVTTAGNAGPGSLRDAIAHYPAGSTISFSNSLSGSTIVLTDGELLLNKSLAIDASGVTNGITLSGGNASRIFYVNSGQSPVSEPALRLISCHLGGSSSDTATGIALDHDGNVYVSGTTLSDDLVGAADAARGPAAWRTGAKPWSCRTRPARRRTA